MFEMPYDHDEYVNMALEALSPLDITKEIPESMRERLRSRVRLLCWRGKERDITNAVKLLLSTPDKWGDADIAEKLCERYIDANSGAAVFVQIVDA